MYYSLEDFACQNAGVLYKAYKKQVNHEAYLNKSDKKHKVYGYEDYKIDLNSILDEDVDI